MRSQNDQVVLINQLLSFSDITEQSESVTLFLFRGDSLPVSSKRGIF